MSYYDYCVGRELAENDPPFYSLIMAAARRADSENLEKLRAAWPETIAELELRYDAPGGLLGDEGKP